MRWVPIGLVGAAAAAMGWISGPLLENWQREPGYGLDAWRMLGWITILLYAPFFVAIVGGTVLAFRALWLATRRADLAARIAMGSTRGSLITGQVREGLRDGLVAGGGGIAVGALARQLRTGFSDVEFVSNTLWDYCAVVILAVACFALAYGVAAAWATRGSVREVASGTTAAAPVAEGSTRTRPRRRRWVLWLSIVAAIVAASALPSLLATDENSGGFAIVVAMAAGMVAMAALTLAVPAILVYGAAKASTRFARLLGVALARGTAPGSARSLAADALARRTPMRTGAAAAIIAVMGASVTMTAMYYALEDANDAAADLEPHASISTVRLVGEPTDLSAPSGWASPLPRAVLDALHEDPALVVIDAGVLTTDARDREFEDENGEPFVETSRDRVLAVDPTALDAVVANAGKRLYLTDGTQWLNGALGSAGSFGDAGQYLAVEGIRAETQEVNGPTPWAGISRPWAEGVWNLAPTAAVILYPAGDETVQDVLGGYDLAGLEVEHSGASLEWGSSPNAGLVAAVTVPFLVIAVAIVVALAWTGQRLRARDQATLLALGATPAALRGAAAIESAVLTASAGLAGCAGGALLGPALAAVGSSAPLETVGWGLVLWNAGHTLAVMPWGLLVGLVVGAAGIAAGGAALIRVRLDRLTPAQQLTEAQKAGIS